MWGGPCSNMQGPTPPVAGYYIYLFQHVQQNISQSASSLTPKRVETKLFGCCFNVVLKIKSLQRQLLAPLARVSSRKCCWCIQNGTFAKVFCHTLPYMKWRAKIIFTHGIAYGHLLKHRPYGACVGHFASAEN